MDLQPIIQLVFKPQSYRPQQKQHLLLPGGPGLNGGQPQLAGAAQVQHGSLQQVQQQYEQFEDGDHAALDGLLHRRRQQRWQQS